jgi:hypothetical protein
MPPKRSRNTTPVEPDSEEEESDGDLDIDEILAISDDSRAQSIVNAAAVGRVNPHTRDAYDYNIHECAVWARSSDRFKDEVVTGAQGEKLKLKWPLNENMIVGFIDFLTKKQTKWHYSNKMKHLAPSTIGHFFSAFRDLYNLHSQPVPDFIDKFFSNTYRKYVLHVSRMKLEGLYPDSTNSIGFSANVYEKICGALVGYWKKGRGASNTVVRYLRLFFIFCYVLLGRGERIGRLRYSWMGWSDDSLLVKIPTSKSDQAGSLSYFKHVHANASNPSVCPVLALAVEVFSRSSSTEFTDRVFPSSASEYYAKSHAFAFKEFLFKIFGSSGLGLATTQITNHSAKRSGIMSVSNAEVIQWHSAELRADHKCGITSSYQTSPSPQQDGVMGRILSCLPLGDALFNIAPPHFEEADISHIPWTEIVSHFDSYDSQFRGTIPFLFASLIFHWNWLQDSMSADHPLWVSKLAVMYDHFIPELQPKLLGGCVDARSILKVTGNSTLCDMHINIKETGKMVSDIHAVVCGSGLGTRGVSGSGPGAHGGQSLDCTVLKELKELHAKMLDMYEQNKKMLKIPPAIGMGNHGVVAGQRPVYYLPSSWRLINGIKAEGLFYKWFISEGSTCAWSNIQNSMLPIHEGRRAQEALFSKYRIVMQCLIGTTRTPFILRDVPSSFSLCWDRMEKECAWTSSMKNDSCVTLYGKIPKDKTQWLKSTAVPGFNSNPAMFAAQVAVHAATMAQKAAEAATSASTSHVAVLANNLFQSTLQLADEVVQSSGQTVWDDAANSLGGEEMTPSTEGDDGSGCLDIVQTCLPRGFLPYPLEAPRPPCEFSTSSLPSGAALVSYQSYIYSNAPVSGAVACWVCPHCLTATASGAFQSQGTLMRRHMREQHKFKDYNSDEVNDYLYKSRLVWCYKPNGAKSWQPVTH